MTDSINFEEYPLYALQSNHREMFSASLDPPKYLQTSDGLFRDWRGVFYLADLDIEIKSILLNLPSPTGGLINILEDEPYNLKLGVFLKWLQDLDRWDIIHDTYEIFVENGQENLVTYQDVFAAYHNLPLQQYDAFVLYAGEDEIFAEHIVKHMNNNGFKLCSQQNFVPGVKIDYSTIKPWLTERCKRMIVILTPDFVNNSALKTFLFKFARSLGFGGQDTGKIIPCIYKYCDLPEIFQYIHPLDYERSKKFDNFWAKLTGSLKANNIITSTNSNSTNSNSTSSNSTSSNSTNSTNSNSTNSNSTNSTNSNSTNSTNSNSTNRNSNNSNSNNTSSSI